MLKPPKNGTPQRRSRPQIRTQPLLKLLRSVDQAEPQSEYDDGGVREGLSIDQPERVIVAPGLNGVAASAERLDGFEQHGLNVAHASVRTLPSLALAWWENLMLGLLQQFA